MARMDERIISALHLLPDYLARHVLICAVALALGVMIGLPLAVLATRRPAIRATALAAVNVVQTIPGLALLALFYPLLLGISTLTNSAFGFRLPALGFLPTVMALTLYSILPVLPTAVARLPGVA